MRRSRVPCKRAIRSVTFFWVVIRPKHATTRVGCQPKGFRSGRLGLLKRGATEFCETRG
jgi:hypothetical protein